MPRKGLNTYGSLHVAILAGVLVETVQVFGATVLWAAAGITRSRTVAAFAWKGETLPSIGGPPNTVSVAVGCGQHVDDVDDAQGPQAGGRVSEHHSLVHGCSRQRSSQNQRQPHLHGHPRADGRRVRGEVGGALRNGRTHD